MESSVTKHNQWLKFLQSLGYYTVFGGVIFFVLFLLKTIILQVIGLILIIAFVAIGFYFLGYLLLGIFSLLIVVGSVICTISLLVYFLA
ncbi:MULTISPECIES: hypothetical protein [Bacillus]|uniref:hypothetical protein n=1 Tax=Bacillus TaxID=1386 RepID=UPI000381F44C|nr:MULTISPECIES: hypothetical protein [Bacillus]PED08297.1 hypothetical protein COO19_10665 [Bacillus pseudomycoides]PGA56733.1 hypothetical protein COL84_27280 [Bacillus pseudomycoides]